MSELDVQRELTVLFIEGNPVDLVLTPHTRVRQANGGWKSQAGPPRPAQRLRVVELAPAFQSAAVVRTDDGTQRTAEYQIVAPWDAEIEVNDTFTYQGTAMRVTHVDRTNRYEVRAPATRHLDPPPTA